MVPTVVYPIPDNISDGYSIRDRIYYGRLFIGSKNKLVQRSCTLNMTVHSVDAEYINVNEYLCVRFISPGGNNSCKRRTVSHYRLKTAASVAWLCRAGHP